MSHMSTVGVVIKDLESLGTACRRLGIELVRGQKTATYYGHNKVNCEHAIRVPSSAHEIAIIKNADGTYSLQADFYGLEGEKIRKLCGSNLGLLTQSYAVEKAKIEARRKGYSVLEKREEDNSITLTLKRRVVA